MKTMKTMKSIKSIKNIKSLKNMKSIKNLEIVESMEDMKNIKNMKSINDVGTTIKNTKIWQDIENINTKTATTGDCASERQESLPAVNEAFESLKVAQMNGDVPSASDTAILLDYCIMLEVKLDKERELAQKALSQEKQIADNEIIDIKTKFHALRRDWITREIQFKDQVKKLELKLCEESLQGMEAVYETRRYSLLDTSKTFQRSVQELLDMKDCIGYSSRSDSDQTCEQARNTGVTSVSNLASIIDDIRGQEAHGKDDELAKKDQPSSDEDRPRDDASGGCAPSAADGCASVHDSQRPTFVAGHSTGSIQTTELAGQSAERPAAVKCRHRAATTGGLTHPHLHPGDDAASPMYAPPSRAPDDNRFSFLPGDDCLPGPRSLQDTQEAVQKVNVPGVFGGWGNVAASVDETDKANPPFAKGEFDPRNVDFFTDTAAWSWNNDEDDAKPHKCDFDRLQKKQEEDRLAYRLAVPKDPDTGQYIFRPSLPRNEPLGVRAEREAEALRNTCRTPGSATSNQKAWPPVRKQQIEAAQRDASAFSNQRSRKALFGTRADNVAPRGDNAGPMI